VPWLSWVAAQESPFSTRAAASPREAHVSTPVNYRKQELGFHLAALWRSPVLGAAPVCTPLSCPFSVCGAAR
jgi:hypothetical protein